MLNVCAIQAESKRGCCRRRHHSIDQPKTKSHRIMRCDAMFEMNGNGEQYEWSEMQKKKKQRKLKMAA